MLKLTRDENRQEREPDKMSMRTLEWSTAASYGGTGALVRDGRLVYAVAGRAQVVSEPASPSPQDAASSMQQLPSQAIRQVTLDACEPRAPYLYSHGPLTRTAIDLSADALGIWALCVGRKSTSSKAILLVHLLSPDSLSVVRQWDLAVDTSKYAEGIDPPA